MNRAVRSEEITIDETPTPAESDNDLIADTILAEAGNSPDDVSWFGYVAKIDRGTETRILQFDPVSEMEGLEQRLREEYGSGDYRIRIYRKNGSEPKRVWKNWGWKIIAKPQSSARPVERPNDGTMATVLAAIERQNDRLAQLFERLAERNNQPPAPVIPADPFASLERIVAVMTGLNDIMKPPNQSLDVVNAVLKGVELAKSVEGNAGGETNWMDLIRDFMRSGIPAAMAAQQTGIPINQQGQQLQPPQPQAPANIPPKPQVKEQPAQQTSEADIMRDQMVNSLGYLVKVAAKNGDPELYAEWVLDNWPRDMVIAVLQQPNAIQLLTQFVPAANAHLPWFNKLIEAVREMIQDETASPAKAAHVSANNSPIVAHGNPGREFGSEDDAFDDDAIS